MTKFAITFLLMFGLTSVFGQGPTANDQVPDIKIISVKWTKSVSVIPSGQVDPDVFVPGQASPEGRTIKDVPQPMTLGSKSGFVFTYYVKFKNDTGRKIKGIAWDHIFSDQKTSEVLDRHGFMDDTTIGSNSTREISKQSTTPPIKIVDARNAGKDVQSTASQSINIKCIIFDDKTVWKNKDIADIVCDELRRTISRPREQKELPPSLWEIKPPSL